MNPPSPEKALRHLRIFLALGIVLFPLPAGAAEGHGDPSAAVLLGLALILVAARLGGGLFERFALPPVLGELLFGVLLGNAGLAGIPLFEGLRSDLAMDLLARIGAVVLLFEVGLETEARGMLAVGLPSLLVAVIGMVAPFLLGYGFGLYSLPEASLGTHLFMGAALTATSVGITARVLKDLNKLNLPESRIILGAAVIDDVLGLVVLAVVSGIVTVGTVSLATATILLLKAVGFLVLALLVGRKFAPYLGRAAVSLGGGAKLGAALVFCFVLAYLADAIGLATIVGAFAAGLILEEAHFHPPLRDGELDVEFEGDRLDVHAPALSLQQLIHPLSSTLVPVFFVLMGMHVRLEAFADPSVLREAALLTLAAIAGKQACGLVVRKGYNRLAIGLGMVPRGEVGLIFASMGRSLGVVDDALYASIVIVVVLTTVVTPPFLKWSLERGTPSPPPGL
jgi:Kef-type K+ transport system membrane component KefB